MSRCVGRFHSQFFSSPLSSKMMEDADTVLLVVLVTGCEKRAHFLWFCCVLSSPPSAYSLMASLLSWPHLPNFRSCRSVDLYLFLLWFSGWPYIIEKYKN